jgi:DNA ligase-1
MANPLPQVTSLLITLLVCLSSTQAFANPPLIPLANVYHQGVKLDDYWVSEKLDGVRAYWDGQQLWSRGGHVYSAPDWFTDQFPAHPMDGELWNGRGRFAELSGIVRKAQPVDEEWREVQYHVFDLPVADVSFELRYRHLASLVEAAESPYLVLVDQYPVESHSGLMSELERIVAAGGEGLMLKRKASDYLAGRSDDLLKVKTHDDAEATVIAIIPGKGKYRGMMGSLEVRMEDGRQFRIGTGFTDADRHHPPALCTTVTFRYRGLTATGLPRFASFLRVREDEPDSKAAGNEGGTGESCST